jgi:prepilin-type N-terminal cleavage/methylation domain-containing protein
MIRATGIVVRRAFTLIELLLAVFILAIGIISVTALFPAGILQQQRAQDDQFGPVVAEAALGILRNRLDPADFGTFEAFGQTNVLQASTFPTRASFICRPTLGDWTWARPSLYRVTSGGWVPGRQPDGAIDVFGSSQLVTAYPGQTGEFFHEFGNTPLGILRGIPFNTVRVQQVEGQPIEPPTRIVTWRERCWPMISESDAGDRVAPEYVWDCMFRRTGGRIQVAIFVYRVVGQGGARKAWIPPGPMPFRRVVAPTGGSPEMVSPAWELTDTPAFPGPYTTGTIGAAQGLLPTDFTPTALPAQIHQWQMPGQWIVDNYGGVHRVLRGRSLGGASESVDVRLSSPIALPPRSESVGDYELELAGKQLRMGIRSLHYMPIVPNQDVQVVPVYATVRDL